MKYLLKTIVLTISFLTLSACSSINSSVGSFFNMDTDLEIKFKVDSDVNPDDDRKPSPLFVRMYRKCLIVQTLLIYMKKIKKC